MTVGLVSIANSNIRYIRFMRIFAGFLGDEASNNSGIIENVDFRGFRTLRLRHLRK